MSVRQAPAVVAATPSSADGTTGTGWRSAASWTVWAALVLAVFGIALSGYLAFENVQDKSGICTGVAKSCHTVQQSKYGKIAGVPVSVPGLLLYAGLAGLAVLWLTNFRGRRILWTQLALLGAFGGFVFSLYLTSIEAFVLDAWCVYCVVSALLVSALLVLWLTTALSVRKNP